MRMVFPANMTGRFLDDLASEMNTFVESVLGDDAKVAPSAFAPRMDFVETETAFVASIDLPGVPQDAVAIDMEDDQLIIAGQRIADRFDGDVKTHRAERSMGVFRRSFALPTTVDKDAISADYENGVLKITMPKLVEEKKSRRIVISQSASQPGSQSSSESSAD